MSRIEFQPSTKRIAAERAGYRCSFPNCGKTTNGPGEQLHDTTRAAIASHIFSASIHGPRGRGGLTEDELMEPANCIWLCSNHGTLIDKNGGLDYPSAVLLSYKQLHESRIEKELNGICSIIGWIHELEITESLLFASISRVRFGKLTLLYGENGAGKSAICNLVSGFFQQDKLKKYIKRALGDSLDVRLTYYQPSTIYLRMAVKNGTPSYQINEAPSSWNPLPMKIIHVSDINWPGEGDDDRLFFAKTLALEYWQIVNLSIEINTFKDSHIRNLNFIEQEGKFVLYLNLCGDSERVSFGSLSCGEMEIVLMEFATAAARLSARYCPTLLILDYPFMALDNWFEFFEPQLLAPSNQFQTLMCTPHELDLEKAHWSGWNVISLERPLGSKSQTVIKEEPKPENRLTDSL